MKWLIIIPGLILLTLSAGCLTADSVETVIELQGTNEPIKVTIIYSDISSDASSDDDLNSDFESLVKDWQHDMHLLDRMEDGFYVKDRTVSIEDGKITGYEMGIVRELDDVNCYLCKPGDLVIAGTTVPPDTRIVMNLDNDDGSEVAEPNGKVIGTGDNQKIIWTGDARKLRVVIRSTDRSETNDKNRTKMIKLLEQFFEKQKQNRTK